MAPCVSMSAPIATTSRYICFRFPAMVISSTAYWRSPFSIQKPLAPRE